MTTGPDAGLVALRLRTAAESADAARETVMAAFLFDIAASMDGALGHGVAEDLVRALTAALADETEMAP